MHGARRRVLDVSGRVEIGLLGAEDDDILALALQIRGEAGNLQYPTPDASLSAKSRLAKAPRLKGATWVLRADR